MSKVYPRDSRLKFFDTVALKKRFRYLNVKGMPMVKNIDKIQDIVDEYDVFIIDLWGVLHNGIKVFLPALDVLEKLKKAHKSVYLLTNNPKTNLENIAKLEGMGLSRDLYTDLISAGQKCLEMFSSHLILPTHSRPLKAFIIEDDDFMCQWTQPAQLRKVENLETADLVLGFHIPEDTIDMTSYKPTLQKALACNLLFVCANPDMYATRYGKQLARVGLLAKLYQEMGGDVIYIGKPHPLIYTDILIKHSKEKILMIGDSLITDIKGANEMGFDGMLISMGNHKEELSQIEQKDWTSYFYQKGIIPTFITSQLFW